MVQVEALMGTVEGIGKWRGKGMTRPYLACLEHEAGSRSPFSLNTVMRGLPEHQHETRQCNHRYT